MIINGDSENPKEPPWEDMHRERRKEALQETDWTQLPDSPLTDSKKAEWRTYRQALRDLPTHSNWPKLEGNEWPTPPS
tara:strand:+ start:1742 stop:1975 length:234 start_codon:yes stop_codon:yes gene_type:complete